MTQQAYTVLDRERSHRMGSDLPPDTRRADGQQSPRTRSGPVETDTADRDAMHQADYGSAREEAPSPDIVQQGGAATDDAAGGGREPMRDRDRDYDPDGERTGL